MPSSCCHHTVVPLLPDSPLLADVTLPDDCLTLVESGGEEAGQGAHQEATGTATSAEQQAQQAAAAAAVEEAAFGGDVYVAGSSNEGQQEAAVTGAAGGAPTVGGEPDADDLYGDLGPVVPQVDGAADSPPRRSRHRGADPGERWELGREGELGCISGRCSSCILCVQLFAAPYHCTALWDCLLPVALARLIERQRTPPSAHLQTTHMLMRSVVTASGSARSAESAVVIAATGGASIAGGRSPVRLYLDALYQLCC